MDKEETENSSSDAAGSESQEAESSASEMSINAMRQLYAMLQRGFQAFYDEDKPKPEQLLDEVSIEGIAKYIASDKCKKVVVMQGAGISTSSGIPDFRSPKTGLYDNLAKFNLPSPQSIFDISYFRKNPKPFFTLAKELYPGTFKPTTAHYFIRLLAEKNYLLRTYTQNIDTLERVAGVPDPLVIEAHGTFHTAHCMECSRLYTQDWMKSEIFTHDRIPTCEGDDCTGVVKPDIVFFGESLPSKFFEHCREDLRECDLLVVMGTSLAVHPFASLVDMVRETTPRLLINMEKVGEGGGIFFGGFDFDSEEKYRDVACLMNCDSGCLKLAELLGWKEELEKLVSEEHKRIDKASAAEEGAKAKVKETEDVEAKLDKLTQKLAKSLDIDDIKTSLHEIKSDQKESGQKKSDPKESDQKESGQKKKSK